MGRGHKLDEQGRVVPHDPGIVAPDVTLHACEVGFSIGNWMSEEGVGTDEFGIVVQVPDERFENGHCEVLVRLPISHLGLVKDALVELWEAYGTEEG